MTSLPFSHVDHALPEGALILVTGASGFIASHIIREALALGYRVRGTVRSHDKVIESEKLFNSPNFEAFVVPTMAQEGAFDSAVIGVDAAIHTASVTTFSPNPNEVIPLTIAGVIGLMKSAQKEHKLRRFVYTSSATAATLPIPGRKFKINKDSWNEKAVQDAWAPPPYDASRSYTVYAASKTQAEQAVWKFVEEQSPQFVVNCVLPNVNLGRILANTGATGHWVPEVLRGNIPPDTPPQHMVDVIDDARIHLAAAMDATVVNERIFAFDSPFNWNDVIDAIRKVRPNASLPSHLPDLRDLSEPDNTLGAVLLRKWWGQDGYKGLQQSVRENLEHLP